MGNEHKIEKYYISKMPAEQITSKNQQQIQPTPK